MRAKTFEQVFAILSRVKFMDRSFVLMTKGEGWLLQVQYMEDDVETGKPTLQKARKWYVSPFSTETEIVETAFKACKTSMEHVVKEHFTYRGYRVYSPHFHILARVAMCASDRFDGRDREPEETK